MTFENNINKINIIIIIFCFFYIEYLNKKIKNFESNHINNENTIDKDELLKTCINSRKLIYAKIRKVNESNLVTIQNKLNYLIVHESPDYKSKLVDKILLHDYSIKKLGKDICVPIIKIYNNTDEIKKEDLPDKFVLKCNHGSAMNIICENKTSFDFKKAKYNLNKWKNINYGLKTNEFQYLNIDRKIFSEKFIKENIEDYKIYCFHGIPKFIRVQKRIPGIKGKINNYYDLNWTLTDIETGLNGYFRRPDIIFERPKNFELMLEYSKKLSEDFVFVRVDLYNVNGIIYLGEMTFCPSNNGFRLKDIQQSIKLGQLIDVSKIKKNLFN